MKNWIDWDLKWMRALIDRIRDFLVQSVRDKTNFNETIRRMTAITGAWDELLGTDNKQ